MYGISPFVPDYICPNYLSVIHDTNEVIKY